MKKTLTGPQIDDNDRQKDEMAGVDFALTRGIKAKTDVLMEKQRRGRKRDGHKTVLGGCFKTAGG